MQVIGHDRNSRRDNATDVLAVLINHIKRHRCPEIHHDRWCSEMTRSGHGIGQSIGSDGFGFGVINADSDDGLMV